MRYVTGFVVIMGFAALVQAQPQVPHQVPFEFFCPDKAQTEGTWQDCVYDGDSVHGALTLMPFPRTVVVSTVRLTGIDTPELRGNCDAEKAQAREARTALRNRVSAMAETHAFALRFAADGDKYGRQLGYILGYPRDRDGAVSQNGGVVNLNEWLVEQGYAVRYDGGTRHDWCAVAVR